MHTRQRVRRYDRAFATAGVLLLAAGCATTGATLGTGVGDRFIEHAPYYAGRTVAAGAAIAYLPIAYQRGAMHAPIFDPPAEDGSAIAALLRDMNAHLDDLAARHDLAAVPASGGTPPDVQFGCVAGIDGDCDDERRVDGDGRIRMRLAVGRPSESWTAATRAALGEAGATSALVITLEVGQYWIQPRGWRNDKLVELGTGHAVRLPWLTSLETPVSVLQLTGALIDTDGRAVRIGAEGLIARRTNIVLSGLGAQRLISAEDVEQLRTSRREDLAGRPLVWQVALEQLVAELAGRGSTAGR